MTLPRAPLIIKKHAWIFLRSGYPVYTYDMRGHGRNGSIRTGDATFRGLYKRLLQIANWIRFKSIEKNQLIDSRSEFSSCEYFC